MAEATKTSEEELYKQYLNEQPSEDALYTQYLSEQNAAEKNTAPEALLQGFGQGASFGYLPEIQAATEQGLKFILPKKWGGAEGFNVENKKYADVLKQYQELNSQMQKGHPIASGAGNILGAVATGIATAPLPGMLANQAVKTAPALASAGEALTTLYNAAKKAPVVGKAVPFVTNVGKAAATGGAYGAIMNPEENQTRVSNAKVGALLGGGLSALGQGLGSATNKYLSSTSGVSEKAIKGYKKYPAEVDNLIENESGSSYAAKIYDDMQKSFFEKKHAIGKALEKQIGGADNLTETSKIFAPIEEHISKLSNSEISLTKDGQDEILALRAYVDSLREGLPANIKPETVWNLKDRLYKASQFSINATKAEKQVANVANKAYSVAKEELNKAANTAGLNKEYSHYIKLQDKMDKYFSDPEKTFKTLQGIETPSKEFARKTAQEIKKELGINLNKPSEILEAYKHFKTPGILPISGGGTTSTSRTLLGAVPIGTSLGAGIGYKIGGPVGAGVGGGIGGLAGGAISGPAAIKKYLQIGNYVNQTGRAPLAGQLPYMFNQATPWTILNKQEK